MSNSPWSVADDVYLCQTWGKVRTQDLARRFKRSPSALKQRARRLDLDAERCYSQEELALVRELYATHTAAQLAERIHGTPRAAKAIYKLACTLGLTKQPHHAPELIEQVRQLHGEGLNDFEIARRLGLSREIVHPIRYSRLKLPPNQVSIKAAGRRAVQTQYATLGIKTAGELRALSYRQYAAENGWPEDLRPREVQILNVLADRGVPMTKHELALAIGMPTDPFVGGKRRILLAGNGPGGTYTASLLRRGFLVRLKRALPVQGQGKGRSRDLYLLGPAALTILEERAKCVSTTIP